MLHKCYESGRTDTSVYNEAEKLHEMLKNEPSGQSEELSEEVDNVLETFQKGGGLAESYSEMTRSRMIARAELASILRIRIKKD